MAPETRIHPDDLDEIASILARGYARYRRSLAIPAVSAAEPPADNCLDSSATPRLRVPAVK